MSRVPTPITLSRPPDNRRALRRRRAGEAAMAWTFVSPAVLIILGLSVVPIVWSLLLSFQADDLVTPSRWVGLDNYRALAQDPHFSQALRNTVLYTSLYVAGEHGGGAAARRRPEPAHPFRRALPHPVLRAVRGLRDRAGRAVLVHPGP